LYFKTGGFSQAIAVSEFRAGGGGLLVCCLGVTFGLQIVAGYPVKADPEGSFLVRAWSVIICGWFFLNLIVPRYDSRRRVYNGFSFGDF